MTGFLIAASGLLGVVAWGVIYERVLAHRYSRAAVIRRLAKVCR